MKMLFTLIMLASIAGACGPSSGDNQNGHDKNPAESGVAGEKDNAETNEEAWANSTSERLDSHATDAAGKSADDGFALKAADTGMAEVELGTLAAEQGSNASIKEFGRMMVTDHSKANDELKKLAAQKTVRLPSKPCMACQKKYDSLSSSQGAAFDRLYAELMVADHREAVNTFKTQSSVGQDQELKKWAGEKLPTLEHHLKMSEDMLKKLQAQKAN
jgi:putative membrane protein